MKLPFRIQWFAVFALCLFVSFDVMAQRGGRGGGGRGNPGGNQGNDQRGNTRGGGTPNGNDPRNNNNNNNNNNRALPPEGATREDVLKITEKARPMLEMIELLQKRTGRPISYEDPEWEFEGVPEKQTNGTTIMRGAEIVRVLGFQNVATPTVKPKDILSMPKATFEVKLIVDARSHLLAEPIDGSLGEIFNSILPNYASKGLPGTYTKLYLGPASDGGYGWVVLPEKVRKRDGSTGNAVSVLDYPITFPVETRPTEATFALIAQLVQKASGKAVVFKHIATDAMTTGRTTTLEPVKLPAKQTVRIGAEKERARDVLARALKTINRGDVRTQGPIAQRSWRLIWLYDKQQYVLDVEDVRQATYNVSGAETGTRPVTWPLADSSTKVAAR